MAVRARPAMYVGDTGKKGLHHLMWEILDNSIDEAMAGHCDEIEIRIHKDGETITVEDNGRGIPVDIHPTEGKSSLEVVMTVLHAGGKMSSDGNSGYMVSGGLHGVGASCVNALSDYMKVEVNRDGYLWVQEYSAGIPKAEVKQFRKLEKSEKSSGTKSTWHPDKTIFKSGISVDEKDILRRLEETAYLNAGLKLEFINESTGTKKIFKFSGGIKDYVRSLIESKSGAYPDEPIFILGKEDTTQVELALAWTSDDDENILGYANNIHTADGGTHITGFKNALTRTVNKLARSENLLKEKDDNLDGKDILEGLTAIVSVKLPQPQFVGQTKAKLGTLEVESHVSTFLTDSLTKHFLQNSKDFSKIVERAVIAQRARKAARDAANALKKKSFLGSSGRIPEKLRDCRSSDILHNELFIVEGSSAAGCFSEKTEVALADGRNLSFKDLVEEYKKGIKNFCYTIREDGTVGFAEIKNPRITKKTKEMVNVILDNGEIIHCTPDHKFMLITGEYKQAKDLVYSDSLMPLYRKYSSSKDDAIKHSNITKLEGCEMIWDPSIKKWKYSHILADEFNLNALIYVDFYPSHRHHIDFNKKNNNPTNIKKLSPEKHRKLHQKMIKLAQEAWVEFYKTNKEYRENNNRILKKANDVYWSNPENIKTASEKTLKFYKKNPERKIQLSELAKEQWTNIDLKKWRAKKTSEQWTGEFRKSRKIAVDKSQYNSCVASMKEYIRTNGIVPSRSRKSPIIIKNYNLYQIFNRFSIKFFGGDRFAALDAIIHHNHFVIKIEKAEYTEAINVYDLEIEETHNFALASGVFVHNSAVSGRDSEYQAVLSIKGKIINAEKSDIATLLKNNEVSDIILAVGTGIKDQFDISKLNYGKIIIMADVDSDGKHILTLLTSLFYKTMRPIIEQGRLYAAIAPLYKVTQGKNVVFCWNDKELEPYLGKNNSITRFKGLGEMNADELGDTTMSKGTRKLVQFDSTNVLESERIFNVLMGTDVSIRKDHIMKNINRVK